MRVAKIDHLKPLDKKPIKFSFASNYQSLMFMDAETFFNKLREKAFLTEEFQQEIQKYLKELHFKAHDGLLSPGYIPTSIYYVQQGLVMGHIERPKHQPVTWFMNEGNFLIPPYFFHQQPATEFITFREQTILLSLSFATVREMIGKYDEALFLFLLLAEDSIKAGKEREYMLRMVPEERYLYLLKTSSFLFRRGHFDLLSSYMNISRRHFVRIRNKFSRR
jgi:CRP-like cAMP-binding protein